MAYYDTYLLTWVAYLVAALGMYYVVVKFTKYWRNEDLKNYLRMIGAVVLFTPASHAIDGIPSIAPAFIVLLGELLTSGTKAAFQGLLPILFALLLGAIALTIQALFKASSAKQAKS
ncbi:hypothetical protein NBRC116188_12880 [Oceaniserpentilla sp. 4NH20-0058]|uniref:hypothetical protein n=1 Tax=Oceaniserpentilla sp. 4NH20-0058 TaxID=3127660 RepID=UPI00310935F4